MMNRIILRQFTSFEGRSMKSKCITSLMPSARSWRTTLVKLHLKRNCISNFSWFTAKDCSTKPASEAYKPGWYWEPWNAVKCTDYNPISFGKRTRASQVTLLLLEAKVPIDCNTWSWILCYLEVPLYWSLLFKELKCTARSTVSFFQSWLDY